MRRYTIKVNDTPKVIDVEAVGANLFRVQIDGRLVDVELTDHRDLGHGSITPVIQTRAASPVAGAGPSASGRGLAPGGAAAPGASGAPGAAGESGGSSGASVGVAGASGGAGASGAPAAASAAASGGSRNKMTAPMPGVILSVGVGVGASVRRGDPLMVLEAMKMKNELKAPRDGVVAEVYVAAGQQVKFGEFLVRFEG